ncbi:MAG TPA: response regulator transcription factor [Bacteroidia bacterium]|nr:response regulator transcription factor [Bacteroidia bacterium]
MPISIALVDDHKLFRKALANLIDTEDKFDVLFEADSGAQLFEYLEKNRKPDIVLLDINMPGQDGFAVAAQLKKNHPELKIIAVTVKDDEQAIIKMIKLGARGYILKDADPDELYMALDDVYYKGYSYSEYVSKTMANTINYHNKWDKEMATMEKLTQREINFLELVCNDYSYKEIAEKMNVSVRTVDGYRDSLFQKINVRTRIGLVIFAIKNGIVKIV